MSIYEFREKYEFRGKDTETGEWRHGFLCESEYHDLMIQWIDEDGFNWRKVIPETVVQYTGLLDCKGQKIFEGDILHDHHGLYKAARVIWHEDNLAWGVLTLGNRNYPLCRQDNCEVIGNRFDNPELLERAENE